MIDTTGETPPTKSVVNYTTPWDIYGIDWCEYDKEESIQRLLISSYKYDYCNKLQVLQFDEESSTIKTLHEIDAIYPPTKVMWAPSPYSYHTDVFAFSGDYIRIYRLDGNSSVPIVDAILNKDNSPDRCSPVSSFDWSPFNTNIIAATCLDSVCTIWDIDAQQPISKVKAHSKEIYDIAFSQNNSNTFITCGEDGSIRLFDIRSIDQYSIVHQNSPATPILRMAWNPGNFSTIAFLSKDDSSISLVDLRNPKSCLPMKSHTAPVNAIMWSAVMPQYLVSAGEDSRCLIWDFEKLSGDHEC
ncbi:hypothetical protein BLSTO_05325 [Blastocystis sp. subtype 1]